MGLKVVRRDDDLALAIGASAFAERIRSLRECKLGRDRQEIAVRGLTKLFREATPGRRLVCGGSLRGDRIGRGVVRS